MSEAISGIARKRVCSCATRFAVTCVALAQAQSRGLPATNQPDGQITADFPKLESSHGIKNIPLHTPGKSPLQARPVSPDERGGSRSSRTRGGMRWTRVRRKTNAAVSRTAKACGSGTAVLVSSSREAKLSGDDGGKKAVRREEHVISRKPLRREGRVFSAEPVCSCAHSFVHFAHEIAGAARTRSSLRPLCFFRGWQSTQPPDASRRGSAKVRPDYDYTAVIAYWEPVIPGRCKASNYDVRLHIGESRDSPMCNCTSWSTLARVPE